MSQYGHDHRSGTARHFTCLLSSLFPTFVRILQQCHIRILASGPQAVCLSAIGLDSLGGFSRGGNECVIYQKGMAVVALELTRMLVYPLRQVFSRVSIYLCVCILAVVLSSCLCPKGTSLHVVSRFVCSVCPLASVTCSSSGGVLYVFL